MNTDDSPTASLRGEHAEMLVQIEALGATARALPLVSAEERETLLRGNLQFLNDVLLRHAEAEEAVLYPQWTELVGYRAASAFLIADHREIKAAIEHLAAIPRDDVDRLQQALYGLQALLLSHFRKEEDLVFPSLDEQRDDLTLQLLEQLEVARHYAVPPPD